MAQTEAGRMACKRYQKKLKAFTVRLKPADLTRYQEAAKRQGKTFRSFVLSAMDKAATDEE